MGRTRISIAVVAVISLILGIILVSPALSAEAQVFATIDIEKAFNDYEKKQELDKQIVADLQAVQSKLELRQTNELLSKTEVDELSTLKAKAKPSDAETKRIAEIEAASMAREKELQDLRQKTTPSEAEKTRLAALQDQIKLTDAELKEAAKLADADWQKKRYELSKQVMDDVQTQVAAVAKAKGITMVFNKSVGETILVVFSTNDITEEVIKKLNKK
jgi:Skp family chaperone for outer membrane proteins